MSAKKLAANQSTPFITSAHVGHNGGIGDNIVSDNEVNDLSNAIASDNLVIIDIGDVKRFTYHGQMNLMVLASKLDLKAKGKKIILCSARADLKKSLISPNITECYIVTDLNRDEAITTYRLPSKWNKLPDEKTNDNNVYSFVEHKHELQPLVDREQSPESPAAPDNRAGYLAALLKAIPADTNYGQVAAVLSEANRDVRREMAARLEPVLNAHIQAMPHETHEEKKTLANWVNAEVEPFGLAVKCPKTGLPAKFRGHPGHWPGIGRFGFEVYIDGKRKAWLPP